MTGLVTFEVPREPVSKENDVSLLAITEKQLSQTVVEMAEAFGWTVWRTWNSRHSPAGEPDLRMVHPVWRRMIWAELKTEKGKLTLKQEDTIRILMRAKQEWYLWRPRDLDNHEIEQALSNPKKWGRP